MAKLQSAICLAIMNIVTNNENAVETLKTYEIKRGNLAEIVVTLIITRFLVTL